MSSSGPRAVVEFMFSAALGLPNPTILLNKFMGDLLPAMFGRVWEKKQQHLTEKTENDGRSFVLAGLERVEERNTQKGTGCGSVLMLIAARSLSKNKHTFLEGKN